MANDQIPVELKQRVTERVRRYGVDCGDDALPPERLARAVDEAAKTLVSDLRLAQDIERSRATDDPMASVGRPADGAHVSKSASAGEPDWDAVFAQANATALGKATNNDLGLNDAWFTKKYEKWVEGANKNWKIRGDAYFSEQELEDFKMLLDVCHAVGVSHWWCCSR